MKIGIYGGSFDPVHLGHEWIVQRALQEGIDRLFLIPCFISPHKLNHAPQASGEDRLEMLKIAFLNQNAVEILDWELRKQSISYAWETLNEVKRKEPQCHQVLLVGGDQFQVIETWTRYAEWARTLEFLVFPRQGETNIFKKQKEEGLRFRVVDGFPPEISSSAVRKSLYQRENCQTKVSAGVLAWINQHQLYDRH